MNMKLEQQVVSLELSKRLYELGVRKESYFYWGDTGTIEEYWSIYTRSANLSAMNKFYPAYTVAELGEMLREKLNGTLWKTWGGMNWYGEITGQAIIRCKMSQEALSIGYKQREGIIARESKNKERYMVRWDGIKAVYPYHKSLIETQCDFVANTEADARAKMLIYLLENNLLTNTQ